MTFDLQENGHAFNFGTGVCEQCGLSRVRYETSGKPRCKGKRISGDNSVFGSKKIDEG